MTFELKDVLHILSLAVMAIAGWVTLKNKVDNLEDRRKDHTIEDERQFKALFDWKEKHQSDSEEIRSLFTKDNGELKLKLGVIEAEYKGLSKNFEKIEGKIDLLSQQINELLNKSNR